MNKSISNQRRIWSSKPLLVEIYHDWYRVIKENLVPGKTVELGSGSGNFKEFMPEAESTDIEPHPWIDRVVDAHKMPFRTASVSNLVMVDVLHHLADPVEFLDEALRVLRPGGRLIMVEPYPSPVSLFIYRLLHDEPFDFYVDYFDKNKNNVKHEANQAIPYLLFFKDISGFDKEFGKKFKIMKRDKFSFITYPLSGGFGKVQLYPRGLKPALDRLEKILHPLRGLLAFRCLIVLEKL